MKFGDLRGILQYVPQFRGETFVVSIDGAVVGAENFANVLLDLAVLHSLNVRVVVVHGAGQQIRELAAERGVGITNADGTGATDAVTLELSLDAVSRLTNKVMQDLTAIGLRAATANAVIAHRSGIVGGVDLGFTGRIDRVDASGLKSFLAEGMVPVVPPLGFDGRGGTLRIDSDAAALAVAEALGARKLLFLTAGEPALTGEGPLGRQLSIAEAEGVTVQGDGVSPRLASMFRHAAEACRGGVDRVHLLDGTRDDETLLDELFTNEGVGVMVYSDDYRQIRAAAAADVPEIVSLIRGAVRDKELLPRRREEVLEKVGDYFVLELDGNIVGTVAVHRYGEDAELACLFVKRSHENAGHGRRLAEYAERVAAERGAGRIVALSTRATDYFSRLGYRQVDCGALPPERAAALSASGRGSKVYEKLLA